MNINGLKKFFQVFSNSGTKEIVDITQVDKDLLLSSKIIPLEDVSDSVAQKSHILEMIPYGAEVETQNLLRLIHDIISNDVFLDKQYQAMMDVLSDGVFDLPDNKFTVLSQEIDGQIVKLKFGAGKLKYTDAYYDQQAVFSSPADVELTVDVGLLSPETYRRDLVSVVYRTSSNDQTGLAYTQGARWGTVPQPAHSTEDAKSSAGYGSQPLYSILLYTDINGNLSIKDISMVQSGVGLSNVLWTDSSYMYKEVDYIPGYTRFRLNPIKSVRMCKKDGTPLTIDYGNAQIPFLNSSRIVHEGSAFVKDELPMEPKLPTDNGAEKIIIPMMVSQDSSEAHFKSFYLKAFGVGMQRFTSSDPSIGIEAHIITYPRLVRENYTDKLSIAEQRISAQLPEANMLLSDLAIRINDVSNATLFPMKTFNGIDYSETPLERKIKIGDFIMFTPNPGAKYPRTTHPIKRIYVDGTTGATWYIIEMPEAVGLAGAQCHVFMGDVISNVPTASRTLTPQDIEVYQHVDTYQSEPFFSKFQRNISSCSVMPYYDNATIKDTLKIAFDNITNPDIVFENMADWRWIRLPFNIELNYSQWYFISLSVLRKTGSNPTYEVVPAVAKSTIPCAEYGHKGEYLTQPGKFPDESIFALYDDYGLISNDETSRPTDETRFTPYGTLMYALDKLPVNQLPKANEVMIDVTQCMAMFKNDSCPQSLYVRGRYLNVINADLSTTEMVHVETDGTQKILASELERLESLVNMVNNYKVTTRDNISPITGGVFGSSMLFWDSYAALSKKGAFFGNVLSDATIANNKAMNYLCDADGKFLSSDRIYGTKCAKLLEAATEYNIFNLETNESFVPTNTESYAEIGVFDENVRHFNFDNNDTKSITIKRVSLKLYNNGLNLGSGWATLTVAIHNANGEQVSIASFTRAEIEALVASFGNTYPWLHCDVDFTVAPLERAHMHIYLDAQTTPIQLSRYNDITIMGFGYIGNETPGTSYINSELIKFWDGALNQILPEDFTDGINPANNIPWSMQTINFVYADLSTMEKWDKWKYAMFIGIDPATGRVKWPLSVAPSRPIYASFMFKLSALALTAADIPVNNPKEYRKNGLTRFPVKTVNDMLTVIDNVGAFTDANGENPRVTLRNGDKVLGISEISSTPGKPSANTPGQVLDLNSKFMAGRIYNAIYNDIAEHMPSDGTIAPGDFIQIDVSHDSFRVTKYKGDPGLYIGICSEEPGICVGANDKYEKPIWCALKGMVWVNSTVYSKACKVGDTLVLDHVTGAIFTVSYKKSLSIFGLDCEKIGKVIAVDEKNGRIKLFV